MRAAALTLPLVLAACRFDGTGVGATDDTSEADAALSTPDADPGAPDAADVPPDAAAPDQDGDGVRDSLDNCVAIGNPEQYNEDGDGHGDACDNCPHIDNDDQATVDGDLVGDICDPYPDLDGDTIALFDGFNGSSLAAGWMVALGANSWTVSGGLLHQGSTAREEKILVHSGVNESLVSLDVAFTPTDVPESTGTEDNVRSAGAVTGFSIIGPAAGRVAVVADLIRSPGSPAYVMTNAMGPTADTGQGGWTYLVGVITTDRYVLTTVAGSAAQAIAAAEPGGNIASATQDATPVLGGAGLRTRNVAVDYEYVIVYGVE